MKMKPARIIDLSHELNDLMSFYPGSVQPCFKETAFFNRDGHRLRKIRMNSHSGTHIDSPSHMLKDGKSLDKLPLSHYIGRGLTLDFSNTKKTQIEIGDLLPHQTGIQETDFVLIYSGFDQYWGSEKYFSPYPVLSKEAVEWLVRFNLKGLGVDMISVDPMNSENYIVHKTLMNHNLIIIENLKNLQELIHKPFAFQGFPLHITGGDGSPVRALALMH